MGLIGKPEAFRTSGGKAAWIIGETDLIHTFTPLLGDE
jgi:hypothetical protein